MTRDEDFGYSYSYSRPHARAPVVCDCLPGARMELAEIRVPTVSDDIAFPLRHRLSNVNMTGASTRPLRPTGRGINNIVWGHPWCIRPCNTQCAEFLIYDGPTITQGCDQIVDLIQPLLGS
jgi:hypothetical protein